MSFPALRCGAIPAFLACSLALPVDAVVAADGPGTGVEVQPLKSSIAEENFQTLLVMQALEDLGYTVKGIKEMDYAAGLVALAKGDATFMAAHWDPLHIDFFDAAGGDETLSREGVYINAVLQGYLIDKETAKAHEITNIGQLKDPEVAKLFDADGNGKADLVGCDPGWGCANVIEYHLDAYGLRDTVEHHQDGYSALMVDTIARYQQGEPVLYYSWTPHWVSGALVPGQDVTWLQVPFSALPGEREAVDTALADGSNYGFPANVQRIIANKEWTQANPAAARLFEVMQLSSNDISAQNLQMRDGEADEEAVKGQVQAWIETHQYAYQRWLDQARAAASQ
ncbi:MAG: proline/glycine betaine ABC transporter substrate-binding protein ProX [Halochromatium sp.]|nr:proline/glycine betaine ABC transporter substrate-binding protein ProX [Halochromatium sp.]